MTTGTEQRRMTAIIPRDGTDRAGYSAMRRYVPPHSNKPFRGKVWS